MMASWQLDEDQMTSGGVTTDGEKAVKKSKTSAITGPPGAQYRSQVESFVFICVEDLMAYLGETAVVVSGRLILNVMIFQ